MNEVMLLLRGGAGRLDRAVRRLLGDRDGVMGGLVIVVAIAAIDRLGGIVFVGLYQQIQLAVTNATSR